MIYPYHVRRIYLLFLIVALLPACSNARRGGSGTTDAATQDDATVRDANADISMDTDAWVSSDAATQTDARLQPDASTLDAAPDVSIGPSPKRVFISFARRIGTFGGLSSADVECRSAAKSASLDGTFIAYLSDRDSDAPSRIPEVGPWVSMRGKVIFRDTDDWRDAPRSDDYGYDEHGDVNAKTYWTGTLFGGWRARSTCLGWTAFDPLEAGQYGSAATDDWWTERSTSDCGTPHSFLCLEI